MWKLRWNVVTLTILLIAFGILFLYSSSAIYADLVFKDQFHFVKRQLVFLMIGTFFFLIALKLDLKKLRRRSRAILFSSALLLVLVLIFGERVGGAKRWFGIYGFGIQPIEFVKIGYIFYLSDFLERRKFYDKNFKKIVLPPYLVLTLFMILLLLQPDFGSVIFVILLTISMLYFAGVASRFLFSSLLLALPFLAFALWRFEYVRLRLLGFLSPWEQREGVGFQLVQSYIAIGSGRIWGQGLGLSKQKLFYLPQAYNDFIFSIIAEECGFIGASLLIILYLILIFSFVKILSRVKGMFGKLFSLGLILSFSYQVAINLGVCLGLLPTKGLPLPFVSYGGSSLIASLIMVALILNISRNSISA